MSRRRFFLATIGVSLAPWERSMASAGIYRAGCEMAFTIDRPTATAFFHESSHGESAAAPTEPLALPDAVEVRGPRARGLTMSPQDRARVHEGPIQRAYFSFVDRRLVIDPLKHALEVNEPTPFFRAQQIGVQSEIMKAREGRLLL